MKIQIGGYYFYPEFFILLIGIPLLVVLLIILIKKIKSKKDFITSCLITKWERNHIPDLLKKDYDEEDLEYNEILDTLIQYIKTSKIWEIEKLLAINQDSIIILNGIIFDEVKECYEEDPDRAVLLLHTIDSINVGITPNPNNWINEDFPELIVYEKGTKSRDELALLGICDSSISKIFEQYISETLNRIPQYFSCYPKLFKYTYEDFASADRDLVSCARFEDISEETFKILEATMIEFLTLFINDQKEDYIDDYYICYFRALASIIDRQPYNKVLQTIEF